MTGQLIIRGLPDSLRNDGWWLTDPADPGHGASIITPRGRDIGALRGRPAVLLVAIALTFLADLSFWGRDPGLSVALFCIALSVAVLTLKPGGATRRQWMIAIFITLICNLPVIEQVQPLSFGFSLAGLILILAWVAHGRFVEAGQAMMTFARASTLGALLLPRLAVQEVRGVQTDLAWAQVLRTLLLPVTIGLIFLLLFASANPLFERALEQLVDVEWVSRDRMLRLLFWIIVACMIWPYLNTRALRLMEKPEAFGPFKAPRTFPFSAYVNARSVTLSLVLFNVMFLAQTLTDIGVLTGGMSLPEGISYAQYAHRGAYPLLGTALLAGLFAICTHRMSTENATLRWMIYAWLGQTLFLVLTAAFRLNLYVQAYSLTYLRITAFIWMGLVLIGLILIIVHIVQSRSLGWLVRSNLIVGAATLYACCFINFTHIIVDHNLNADVPPHRLDLGYLCGLGEQAIPAMIEFGQVSDDTVCCLGGRSAIRYEPIETWQEWGFRRWRLGLYLAAHHDL